MKLPKILVIGSVHLDVVAEVRDDNQESLIDKIGSEVRFSFGGAAINIAAHLQDMDYKPYLMTALDKSSIHGGAAMSALRAGGLSRRYVLDDKKLDVSAFVATMKNKRMHSAISCMRIEESNLLMSKFESVISRFRWVVFDCNLSRGMIERIAVICQQKRINLIGSATSDSKAIRLVSTLDYGTRALCMNEGEAKNLMRQFRIGNYGRFSDSLMELRSRVKSQALLVTLGSKGAYLATEELKSFGPPEGIVPSSTLGAGGAACAGFVDAIVRGSDVSERVNAVVKQALQSRYPSKFAERTSSKALRGLGRKRRVTISTIILALLIGFFKGLVSMWPSLLDIFRKFTSLLGL